MSGLFVVTFWSLEDQRLPILEPVSHQQKTSYATTNVLIFGHSVCHTHQRFYEQPRAYECAPRVFTSAGRDSR